LIEDDPSCLESSFERRHLKYFIEVIQLTNVEKLPDDLDLNLKSIKTRLKCLLVMLPFSCALFGCLQTAFLRGATLGIRIEDGYTHISTYIYALIAVSFAMFQLRYVYLFLGLFPEV